MKASLISTINRSGQCLAPVVLPAYNISWYPLNRLVWHKGQPSV